MLMMAQFLNWWWSRFVRSASTKCPATTPMYLGLRTLTGPPWPPGRGGIGGKLRLPRRLCPV